MCAERRRQRARARRRWSPPWRPPRRAQQCRPRWAPRGADDAPGHGGSGCRQDACGIEVGEAMYRQGSQARAFAKEEFTAASKKAVYVAFAVVTNSEHVFLVAYQKGPLRTARPLRRPWRLPPKVRSTQPAGRSTSSSRDGALIRRGYVRLSGGAARIASTPRTASSAPARSWPPFSRAGSSPDTRAT